MHLQGELVMRYAEKLDQLPVAGKAEEMRLIQVNMWEVGLVNLVAGGVVL